MITGPYEGRASRDAEDELRRARERAESPAEAAARLLGPQSPSRPSEGAERPMDEAETLSYRYDRTTGLSRVGPMRPPEGLERLQLGLWLLCKMETMALPAEMGWVLPHDLLPGVENVYGYPVVRADVGEPMIGLKPR